MRLVARLASLAGSLTWLVAVGCGDDKPAGPLAGGGNVGKAGSSGVGNRDHGGDTASGAAPGDGGAGGVESVAEPGGEAGAPAGGAPSNACNDGKGAVISGRVLAPNGTLPLGGVTVYVPSATVDPLPSGAACFRCESAFNGVPVAMAVTTADGHFELAHAPVGKKVPLVVQTGKWRRTLELNVTDCQDNAASEDATRLPSKRSEGSLPAMALVSGGEDTLECLLRKIGIADTEFTFTSDKGAVRLYQGKGGMAQLDGVAESELTPAQTLWSDPERLSNFDLVLLGSEPDANAAAKPKVALDAVHGYIAAGGRVLAQHHQSYFLSAGAADVAGAATYGAGATLPDPFSASVDETSARGRALAEQLLSADSASTRGKVTIKAAENGVQAVKKPAVRLLFGPEPATVQAFSLDLAKDATEPACGRVTQTDILTAAGDTVANFPKGCSSTGWSEQERALAYLIFDLGACLP